MLIFLFTFILLAILEIIKSIITYRYLAKKCNYDCDKCKCISCPYHYCERKRVKYNEKIKREDSNHVYQDTTED